MSIVLERLADELTISPDELERRSLLAFVDREQRLAKMDIADFEDRYGVHTSGELVVRIEQGSLYSHPAWEDSIEWAQLEAYLERLARWQAELDRGHV